MDNDPFDLRSLPASAPPEHLWSAIAAELDAADPGAAKRDEETHPAPVARIPTGWIPSAWVPIAAAASLAVAIACVSLLDSTPDQPVSTNGADPALVQARAESAGLEQLLRRQRDGVLDASSVESLAWIEHELDWLDMQLADNPADIELWQQRVELLEQMTRHYESNSWQARIQLASY